MKLTIELDREVDGRWIADIPELNILLYGATRDEAIEKAEAAAREIIADRIARGDLPAEAAHPENEVKLEWLRAAVNEGTAAMDRGDFTVIDSEEKLRQLVRD